MLTIRGLILLSAHLLGLCAWAEDADMLPPIIPQVDGAAVRELSLEQYVDLAVAQGGRGRQAAITLRSAGHSRRATMRQTDSPSLTASFDGTLNETRTTDPVLPDSLTRVRTVTRGLSLTEPLPTGTVLTVSGRKVTTLTRTTAGGVTQESPRYSLALTQPVYLFVKNAVLRTRKRAGLAFDSSNDAFKQEVLAIKAQARSLYYEVMLQTEAVEVQKRKTQAALRLLKVTEALIDAGRTPGVAGVRARLRVQQDRRQLRNALLAKSKALLSAKNFVSLPLEQEVEFVSKLGFEPLALTRSTVIDYAARHRPEIVNQQRAVELERLAAAESREATRPTLNLSGGYDWTRVPGTDTRAWNAGVSVSWLLFDSFVTRDRVRGAALSLRAAEIALQEIRRSTLLEVNNAFLEVENAEQQIKDFEISRDQAAKNVALVRLRYQYGTERLLDAFDAEDEARNLELEYLNLLVAYRQALDRLAQVIGSPLDRIR